MSVAGAKQGHVCGDMGWKAGGNNGAAQPRVLGAHAGSLAVRALNAEHTVFDLKGAVPKLGEVRAALPPCRLAKRLAIARRKPV